MKHPLPPKNALLALGLLLAAPAAAQSPAATPAPGRPQWLPAQPYPALLGGRVGYSRFTLRGTEVDRQPAPAATEPLEALPLGLVVRARLAGPLAFQTELGYVRKGGRLTGPYIYPRSEYIVDYLQIPALLHLSLLRVGSLTLAAEAGYAANLSMGGPDLTYRNYPPGTDIALRGVVFAPLAGAEISWQQRNRHYFLHARYSRDQSEFYTRDFSGQSYGLRNAGFTLTTGVLFGFER